METLLLIANYKIACYITTSWNAFKLHCSRKHPNGSIQSTDKNSLLFIDGVSSDDSDYDD